MKATGIHVDRRYRLGLIPEPAGTRRVRIAWRAGKVPPVEPKGSRLEGWAYNLGRNNQFGTCGPTSVANHRELTTFLLTGKQDVTTDEEVFTLYRESGNPNFDPATGRDDNGVVMSVMLDALKRYGLGDGKCLGYASLVDLSDASIAALIDAFGGCLFAVTLQAAQQNQTARGLWDYSPSRLWGGHAILAGSWDLAAGRFDVVTWAERVGTTREFRRHQLDEVWLPLWDEDVHSGKFFRAGLDTAILAADWQDIFGQPFPAPLPPPAPPPPAPATGQIIVDLAGQIVKLPPGWDCVHFGTG